MKNIKICLLVDDDVLDQAIFLKAVTDVSANTICYTASNGIEALYMMNEEDLRPDYIFVEMDMPRMDGVQFLQAVKKQHSLKNIPVIVHSPFPRPEKINGLKKLGAYAIHFKQYKYADVCNMLRLCFQVDFGTQHVN